MLVERGKQGIRRILRTGTNAVIPQFLEQGEGAEDDGLVVYGDGCQEVGLGDEDEALIEAVTYRLGDHTTADDASRYRSDEEVAMWRERDPIPRLKKYLEACDLWDDAQELALESEAHQWVDVQVAALEAMPPQPPEAIFEYMYDEMPPHLEEQMAALKAEVER